MLHARRKPRKTAVSGSRCPRNRALRLETLESRQLLSVVSWEGLLDTVGTQPEGALTGKIVYTSGGHGLTADNTGDGSWTTQRGEYHEMIEDMGNQDQLTFYVDALFRAGATVVPMRPVGHQTNEVVLDNDDSDVQFVGAWSNSVESIFYGSAGDVPYRYAATSASQTAYARYRPTIPEAGYYPVYAWARAGTNRVSDQLYVVHHSGGATEVTINHKAVGNGFVYLGTYHFEKGKSGYVDVSNRSGESGYVIADAIRFGNGMGDINRGGGVSGYPREDEAGLYWIMAQSGQGVSSSTYRDFTSDRSSTIRSPILWATHMNQAGEGDATDRVYLGFHSNGSNGSARGTVGLYNTGGSNTPTINQIGWARLVAESLDETMAAIGSPPLENTWYQRSSLVYGSSYGEIDNRVIGGEFDATIIEIAFHDNELDAELMRDPNFREWAAQACVQGTADYFAKYDTVASSLDAPDPVANVRAVAGTDGSITISWDAPPSSGAIGDLPSGYQVYASTNGYGFNGGTVVPGRTNTSLTIRNVDTGGEVVYFRVAAVNAGGESKSSETVAARPTSDDAPKVLIVNGFDRLDRSLNVRAAAVTGTIDRVRPQFSNSFDYCVPLAEAIEPYSDDIVIDTVQNEAVVSGEVDLGDYESVFWILGEESVADETFSAAEQTRVTQYLAGGGTLFVSGAEIGWDLDHMNNGRTFYRNTLHAAYASDDAGTYAFTGKAGSIFAGISATFDDGDRYYDAEYPDVLAPQGGAVAALSYSGGTGGTAGIQYADGETRLVMLGFPFETVTDAAVQEQMMDAVLTFFGTITDDDPPSGGDLNGDGIVGSADLDLVRANWGRTNVPPGDGSQGDASGDGKIDSTDLDVIRANWGPLPSAAATPETVAPETVVPEPFGPRLPDADLQTLARAAWLRELEARRTSGKTRPQAGQSEAWLNTAFSK